MEQAIAIKAAATVILGLLSLLPLYLATIREHRFMLLIGALNVFATAGLILDNLWFGIVSDDLDIALWLLAFFLVFTPSGREKKAVHLTAP